MGKVYFSYVRCFSKINVQNDRTWQEMNKNDKIEAWKDPIFVLNIDTLCLYHYRLDSNLFMLYFINIIEKNVDNTMGKVYLSYVNFFLFFLVQNDRKWQEMNKNDKIEARKDQIFILNIKNTCLYHNRLIIILLV